MKERIIKFLSIENISASKFADEIGVQRSGISHIISGRNKPSLDLIQKILNRFDFLNPDWFILGKGEMYRNPDKNTHLFNQEVIKAGKNQINNEKELEPERQIQPETSNYKEVFQNNQGEIVRNINSGKEPVKLFVIYKDGSFESFGG